MTTGSRQTAVYTDRTCTGLKESPLTASQCRAALCDHRIAHYVVMNNEWSVCQACDWSVATLEAAVRAPCGPLAERCTGNGDSTVDGVDAVSLSSFHKPSAACVCLMILACGRKEAYRDDWTLWTYSADSTQQQ